MSIPRRLPTDLTMMQWIESLRGLNAAGRMDILKLEHRLTITEPYACICIRLPLDPEQLTDYLVLVAEELHESGLLFSQPPLPQSGTLLKAPHSNTGPKSPPNGNILGMLHKPDERSGDGEVN